MKKLRVGIAGYGVVGKRRKDCVDLHPNMEMVAICDQYFDDIARICAEEDVPYYNLNLDSAFCCEEWLFIDRVHLTDRGHALAAEIIKREFNL